MPANPPQNMSDRRYPISANSRIRVRGRQPTMVPVPAGPTLYNIDRREIDTESEDEDPELKPYVWSPRPKNFKGPTKVQLTERQFNPMSVLPLSPDSQWRKWEACQKKKEKEHNARMQVLLAERERYRARGADEEDDEMDDETDDGYRHADPPIRYYTPQRAGSVKNVRNEQPDNDEGGFEDPTKILRRSVSTSEKKENHSVQPERRKRLIWNEQSVDEVPVQESNRASKRRKQNDKKSQSSYVPYSPYSSRPFRRTQRPTRRPTRPVQEWRPLQNRFRHNSPLNRPDPSFSRRRPGQENSLGAHSKADGDERYSHPGQTAPRPPKAGPVVPTSYSPAARHPHPYLRHQSTPEPQTRFTPEISSPELSLFVSQSPRREKDWPEAAMKDKSEDSLERSSLKPPSRSSSTHDPQSTANKSGNADEGAANIEVTGHAGPEEKKTDLKTMFSKVELGTKHALDAPLDNLALVQKIGFFNLKEDYRRVIDRVERYKKVIVDKDREIARLEKSLKRESRGRGRG
ncbi:hypothetical protein BKA65DRAFT_545164 [Rhexocercosporidium sp. MPI-PUGE-AT-0058]|nr:hypothetical protein BKA65DRAFT_545164 [Rhexocercosporidium sp. MPI-PUGE-AT-0058]